MPELTTESATEQVRPEPSPANSEARLRCLWLTKGLGRGGVERLLVDLFSLVDQERFQIDVAYVLPWKDAFHGPLEQLGARVICLGSGPAWDVRWVQRLRRLIEGGNYDIIHTHAPVPAVAARLLTTGSNQPALVHTEHNMWSRYRSPTRLANSVTYHRNSQAIAVSDTVAESIQPWRSSKAPSVHTVHHGTNLKSICRWSPSERRRRREAIGLPIDGFVVGNVANFTPKKNHAALIEALAGTGSIAGAHLALVGLGPLQPELQAMVDRLGLTERVTFLGSRDDVFELLPLFDAFCLSSRFEGFPIALVEAMATGLACVATTVGGIPEIITDGTNGLLVGPEDVEGLRRALESVIDHPEQAELLGGAARASAENLDLATALEAIEEIYRRPR